MKIVTWNVNGLRAAMKKGLPEYIANNKPDIIGLQEIKLNAALPELAVNGFASAWNHSERLGYSGTVCLFKTKPLTIKHGIGVSELDTEGRVITLEYPQFFYVNAYVPNSQGGTARWYFRLDFDEAFCEHLETLSERKPVIVGGDFNVAREYIDVYPENLRNEKHPHGFLSEERDAFNTLLGAGFTDIFRELHPDDDRGYSWWSNRLNKRSDNRGWRIDYFLVSAELRGKVKSCVIRSDVLGSDHAPLELELDI
jgi:exodeoxyribonuclease-3